MDRENVKFFGWQPNDALQQYIMASDVCIAFYGENPLARFLTDKSLMKINEYLNLGRSVVATGMMAEESRKNLTITDSANLSNAIRESLRTEPQKLDASDYRLWELQCEKTVREIYGKLGN